MTLAVAALASPCLLGCGRAPKDYRTTVMLKRVDVITRPSAAGPPSTTVDVEFEYPSCPGEQVEVIRGDAKFAECLTAAHKVGDTTPVRIRHARGRDGVWDWDVIEMAGCARPPLDGDEASFDVVQECAPIRLHGREVGFRCTRVPEKALLASCPWFARR